MTTSATPEGTRQYAARYPAAAEGHFREAQRLALSSLGIGTYLGNADEETDRAYTAAIVEAVQNGINVIDTAINYRFQRSERNIGEALVQLQAAGITRDQLVLCTKAGFLTPEGGMPADPNEYFFREYIHPGVLDAKEIVGGGHCMSPRFLKNQLGRSLQNMGIDVVDVFYLHNPETQLAEITKADFLGRIREAFTFLESAVVAGEIQYYGVATWNAFRQDPRARDSMQLADLVQIAQEIAGGMHRFRLVQLPFNLGMTEALTLGNQIVGGHKRTVMEAADELDVALVASASLLQGQVAANLPGFVAEALGLQNDAERALQFVRSAPGITTALVGMSRAEHARANAKLLKVPTATVDQFSKLFSRGERA
ncbi:MAG TPA: aldo/keto reductase [Candidatus Acidoferrum sp.]|jgi:aryl-alcohol dehydrogenase-like predicted oxidoreductase